MQFITNPSLKVMISKCFGSLLLSKEIQKFCPEQETMFNTYLRRNIITLWPSVKTQKLNAYLYGLYHRR